MFDVRCSILSILLLAALTAAAAEPDFNRLPPAANATIDFDHDVRPIFEASCFRCHGPERPKSEFRLDTRDTALKGGNNNRDDIVPGDSAHSRLIHYAARAVENMEMPPPGKGNPLTPEQVGILRAWIDQGAKWGTNVIESTVVSLSPAVRVIGVSGDNKKFRELYGFKEGWGGGYEDFFVQQITPEKRITVQGHLLTPDQDYQVKLMLEKPDLGFVRAGYERWRRYYDDTGGFYRAFSPPSFDLDNDLHLDIGRAWIDFGLTLPERPRVVLGYEYQFRDGTKSMLEWGSANGKNIYPAAKAIDERVHILKLDVSHELAGWRMEDNARVEFYRNQTHDAQIASYTSGPGPDAIIHTREKDTWIRGANVLRVEKQITGWWFASAGYLYSRLEADSALDQATTDAMNAPTFGTYWNNDVTLRRETHLFSAASSFLPIDGLSLSLAAQSEWTQQEGFGDVHLDSGNPTLPGFFFTFPGTVRSDLDQTKTSESAALRYTKIPFTLLFAEARLSQDRIGQFEEEAGSTPDTFLRDTDFANNTYDLRGGFSVSPRRWIALNASYRRRDSDSDYDHRIDDSPLAGEGYSAFIRHREIVTDEAQAKVVLHAVSWLKATLTYEWTDSDYSTTTDPVNDGFFGNVTPGGNIHGGTYRAHVYGLGLTYIPSTRLYFSGTFTYGDSRLATFARNEVSSVVPYDGAVYSVLASATFVLNPRTRLQASYSFSRADYGQDNPDGVPLGIDYTQHGLAAGVVRKLTANLSASVRYSFYQYAEPSSGGLNDFTAHGVFASLVYRWP